MEIIPCSSCGERPYIKAPDETCCQFLIMCHCHETDVQCTALNVGIVLWNKKHTEATEKKPMTSIQQTLDERGKRYGEFPQHAEITDRLQKVMGCYDNWHTMKPDQREALRMITHKIGRILNGDPDYADSWVDIAGYAQLVVNRLESQG